MKKGKFIVIEGGEGAGKSTLLTALKAKYSGEDTVFSKEPGGTPLGEKLRTLILSEDYRNFDSASYLFMFSASRAELLNKVIKPALIAGKNVICDRFVLSTYAYQIHALKRENLIPVLECVNNELLTGFEPDMYIFLDVLPNIGMQRIATDNKRNGLTVFDKADEDFFKLVREGYKKYLPVLALNSRIETIDTTNIGLKEVEEIAFKIISEELKNNHHGRRKK